MVSAQPASNASQNAQPRSSSAGIAKNIGKDGSTNQKVARAWAAMVVGSCVSFHSQIMPSTETSGSDATRAPAAGLRRVEVQHPEGRIQVEVELSEVDGQFKLVQAALVRTARKILEGTLFVPESAPAH